ncbi:HlyD family secretion protein [Kordiimonas pumila]|uniref:HlyD family secretion protein n=1 Tax=Kordiimonas pumila TaxID=2161677 RepID=A0ABV7D7Q8_9PROT|nr:HlyD family secretion protein [Kordiimonas pumila]
MKRLLLYISVPAAIIFIVAFVYISGGRIIVSDNAYIRMGIISGASKVSGEITAVHVKRNQHVTAGDLIAELDDVDAQAKLLEAKAKLLSQRSLVEAIRLHYFKTKAALEKEQETLAFETREFKRAEKLAKDQAVSEANLDDHRHKVEESKREIAVLEQDVKMALSQIGNNPDFNGDQHPMVLQALAAVRLAELALEHLEVRVHTDGIITQLDLHPGEFVTAGYPIFGLTVEDDMRIEANLKETELTHVKIGQVADVEVDALPGIIFKGKIVSINPATGSEFAVLPAQNATGNWVKVTQRIPVQIELDKQQDLSNLRAGYSVEVSIDTGYERSMDDLLHIIGL